MKGLSSYSARLVVVAIGACLAVGVGYFSVSGPSTRKVSADFIEAVGVYPGTPVKILGVDVGEVTAVTPEGDVVRVEMVYDARYRLPPTPYAALVANSLVSDRFIQLSDVHGAAYAGSGPYAPDHARIPSSRTQSPAELDAIYDALNDLAAALGPAQANKNGALSELLTVAAANLKGNGAVIATGITNLSRAARALADNRGNLFTTVKNLQLFTKALHTSDGALRHFEAQLAVVASDLADERDDFGSALHQLAVALDAVARFVRGNAAKLHVSLTGLATVTRVLVAEKASINEALAIGPAALSNVVHAYMPAQSLVAGRGNLASLTDPGQICSALSALSGGGLLGLHIAALQSLLGSLLTPVVETCNAILTKSDLATDSAGTTALTGSQLVQVVHASVGVGDVGGLITGG